MIKKCFSVQINPNPKWKPKLKAERQSRDPRKSYEDGDEERSEKRNSQKRKKSVSNEKLDIR